jgi:malonate decarboxylase gamma subunit
MRPTTAIWRWSADTLRDAIADARAGSSLKCRLGAENRRSSQQVRDRMRASW